MNLQPEKLILKMQITSKILIQLFCGKNKSYKPPMTPSVHIRSPELITTSSILDQIDTFDFSSSTMHTLTSWPLISPITN